MLSSELEDIKDKMKTKTLMSWNNGNNFVIVKHQQRDDMVWLEIKYDLFGCLPVETSKLWVLIQVLCRFKTNKQKKKNAFIWINQKVSFQIHVSRSDGKYQDKMTILTFSCKIGLCTVNIFIPLLTDFFRMDQTSDKMDLNVFIQTNQNICRHHFLNALKNVPTGHYSCFCCAH